MSEVTEITEDIEIIGPGRLLSDARKAKGLSIEQVADQLNFRKGLVKEIEDDHFDRSLPSTFNRGYLKNYAKLVDVPEEDVLSSFEMLGVAEKQSTEMQSFSKITEKQAQTRSLMWLSYLILAILIGSTLVWFYQYQSSIKEKSVTIDAKVQESVDENVDAPLNEATENSPSTQLTSTNDAIDRQTSSTLAENTGASNTGDTTQSIADSLDESRQQAIESVENNTNQTAQLAETNELLSVPEQPEQDEPLAVVEDVVVFTFSGDCWVNIYDATGERIAWGVKKTDYVMTIKGVAPFNVTLGKPELVSIDFAGQPVDMSQFSAGNIAKFTLPIASAQ